MALESLFRLQILFSLLDGVSGPLKNITSAGNTATSSMKNLQQRFVDLGKAGTILYSVGKSLLEKFMTPISNIFETRKALSELSSLGIQDLDELEAAASSFTQVWAGTNKAEFLTAAYDIKSGISSLSDTMVGKYTEIAGITAKATKSTIAEMTSLFAQGYGIYKGYYSYLSDTDFAEMLSAGISSTVQKFKTNGSEMASAISNLGASATNANVPLEEQLTVLGMLQATMDGSRAGTQYTSFLKNAAKAGETLGIKFTDANNQLLSLPQILTLLKSKFGETIDATEKLELTKAFGDQEAVKLIDLLYSKTDELTTNITDMYSALGSGLTVTKQMAEAMNSAEPDKLQVVQQKLRNISEIVGNSLRPTVNNMIDIADRFLTKLTEWAEANPKLVSTITMVVIGLASFATVCGAGMIAVSFLGIVFGVVASSVKMFNISLGLVGTAIKSCVAVFGTLNTILSTTAFTIMGIQVSFIWVIAIIAAVIAIGYALYKNWDTITEAFASGCEWIKNSASNAANWITNKFNQFVEWMKGLPSSFLEIGKSMIDKLVEGITSVASKPFEAISGVFNNVRKLLPFSDAKEGPLSDLTLSGTRVVTTLVEGMEKKSDLPAESISNTFRKVKKVNLVKEMTDTESESTASTSAGGIKHIIEKLVINANLKDIKDLQTLIELVQELEEASLSKDDDDMELEMA